MPKVSDYSWVTDEMFDKKLGEILEKIPGDSLVAEVPNIYSEVKEYFNNQVLQELALEREDGE